LLKIIGYICLYTLCDVIFVKVTSCNLKRCSFLFIQIFLFGHTFFYYDFNFMIKWLSMCNLMSPQWVLLLKQKVSSYICPPPKHEVLASWHLSEVVNKFYK